MRTYAIGDIHGQLALLEAAHSAIEADLAANPAPHEVVHIGDYVDRGPKSCQVIEYLIEGQAAGAPWIFLRGNHDRMMQLAMDAEPREDPCLRKDLFWCHARLGGLTTIAAYGVEVPRVLKRQKEALPLMAQLKAKCPERHVAFLAALQNSYETDDCFFAHAGVNPERSLGDQVEDDLIWIRDPFLKHEGPLDKLIIHGHTPCERLEHSGNRVNIDTGAAYGYPLSTIGIEGRDVFEVTPEGRRPIA